MFVTLIELILILIKTDTHSAVFAALGKHLLNGYIILNPTVGDKEAHEGWVVDSGRAVPGQHHCCSVQRTDLHVVRNAAANWRERKKIGKTERERIRDRKKQN